MEEVYTMIYFVVLELILETIIIKCKFREYMVI